MTTRKQKAPASARARRRPAQRGAARDRPPGAKTARASAAALRLAAQCTVAEADTLKTELARRLQDPRPVKVDVSALQRIDMAGLQLLAAFVRDRRTAGRSVEWRGRAAALAAAASLLGLEDMLELAGEVGR